MTDSMDVLGTPYSYEKAQQEQLEQLSSRVRAMRDTGRLSPQVLANLRRYFRTKNIYHSNAIEGNLLDIGETRLVVEMGLTISGKPLKDQAEAKNLAEALDFLEELATQTGRPILESDIRQLHHLVLKGINDDNAGRYRTAAVEISGSAYKPPSPESVGPEMRQLGAWLESASVPGPELMSVDGFVTAVAAHTWFVTIHPFIDGNGRVGRLLLNLVLMRFGFPIAIVSREDRARYYDALEESHSSDLSPLISLILECLNESVEEYEAAVTEHRVQQEWAQSIANTFTSGERTKASNEYEVWKSAMDLMRGYFRQTAFMLDEAAELGRVYFKEFGHLEFEKYVSLRVGRSAKQTWFFRIDLRSGERAARYLFFVGSPSYALRSQCDVTIHVAREEAPFHFERLENISAPNCPSLLEVGYKPTEETFVARLKGDIIVTGKIENIGRNFIEEVVKMHFG